MSRTLNSAYRTIWISAPVKPILVVLAQLADDDGTVSEKHGDLAVYAGFSVSTVKVALAKLVANKYLEHVGKSCRGVNVYRVRHPDEVERLGVRVTRITFPADVPMPSFVRTQIRKQIAAARAGGAL